MPPVMRFTRTADEKDFRRRFSARIDRRFQATRMDEIIPGFAGPGRRRTNPFQILNIAIMRIHAFPKKR